MWQAFADVKTADDLHLPSPPLAQRRDGQRRPEMVVIPPSEQVLAYVRELGRRAELVAGRGWIRRWTTRAGQTVGGYAARCS